MSPSRYAAITEWQKLTSPSLSHLPSPFLPSLPPSSIPLPPITSSPSIPLTPITSSLLQVVAEGVPQLLRCLVVVCGITMAAEWGLLVFCVGQVSTTQSLPPPPLPLFPLYPSSILLCSLPPSHYSLPLPPTFFSPAFLLCHQLVYSLCYLLIYYGYFTLHTSHPHTLPIRTISHILPSPSRDKVWCTVPT